MNITLKAFPVEFSQDSHSRLQKEVSKIYDNHLKENLGLLLPPAITQSFTRYLTTAFEAEDYMCVLNAQDFFMDELEDLFTEFAHSESFFKWSGEYSRLKAIRNQPYQFSGYMEVSDGSAMMNGMENELTEACMKLTGRSRDERDNGSDSENHTESLFITLDSLFEGNFVNAGPNTPVTFKDDDDDEEIHAPGEMFDYSKLSLVQESLERCYLELDSVNLLLSKFNNPSQDPLVQMQFQILLQTKQQLSLEISDAVKQKAKFERQNEKEAEALMPGQCFVTIQEVVPSLDTGKTVTYFLIQIDQRHLNTGWTVKRRYSDFDSLHRRLREKFPIVDDFDFPAKSSVLWARVRSDTKARAKGLEKYLQRVIDSKDISKSDYVKNFLSSSFKPEKLKTRLFNFDFDQEVQDGLSGLKRLNASKIAEGLAKLGVKNGNNLFGKKKSPSDEDLAALAESDSDLDSDEDVYSDDGGDLGNSVQKPNSSLVSSINNLAMEVFDMKEGADWLKESASLNLLEQLISNNGNLES
jgi:PX domain